MLLFKPSLPERQLKYLRQRAKEKVGKPSVDLDEHSEYDVQQLIEELQIYQAELEIQNEELIESQLRAEQVAKRYQYLYDYAPIGYITLTEDGRIEQINHTGAEMLETSRSFLMNIPFLAFVHPDDHTLFLKFLKMTLVSEEPNECELHIRVGRRKRLKVLMKSGMIPSFDKSKLLCQCAMLDLTEKHIAEEEVKKLRKKEEEDKEIIQNEKVLRDMAESLTGTIFRTVHVGEEKTYKYISPQSAEVFGVTADVVRNQPQLLERMIHPSDHKHWIETIAQAERDKTAWYVQARFITPSGKMKWIEGRAKPSYDKHEELVYNGMWHDITDHKKLEDNLQMELELAKKVQVASLSKGVKHERISISSLYSPSSHLAGDLFRWFKIDEDRYGIIVIDVMGHGVPSALVNMWLNAQLKDIIIHHVEPRKVIQELNHRIYDLFSDESNELQFYATALYVVINMKTKQLSYANAGHPAAILVSEVGDRYELSSNTIPIGMFSKINLQPETIQYVAPLSLHLYTDGLIDQLEDLLQQGSAEAVRLQSLLYRYHKDVDGVTAQFSEFIQKKAVAQRDDICFLAVHLT